MTGIRTITGPTVLREARDFQCRRLGLYARPYDGTLEDAVRVAQAISDEMFAELGSEVSNGESLIFVTDGTGRPRWKISPNFRFVVEIEVWVREMEAAR
ncbi:MAG: hypothetical protein ACT4PV_14805 [Planctomycetaceae bacterium]